MPHPFPVYADILNQPIALAAVLDQALGPGLGALQEAAGLIQRAPRLVVAAIGASYTAALPFAHRLASAGRPVVLADASELLHSGQYSGDPHTCYLLISRSGESIEIARLLERYSRQGSPVIGLTNVAGSRLATDARVHVWMASPPDEMIAIQTYTASLLILHLLAELVLDPAGLKEAAGVARSAVLSTGRAVQAWAAESAAWAASFRFGQALYLLGRGAALASVYEGQLLFHEMARYPAVAFSAGAFRHGPWEVVDANFCGFVFAPADATYDLNIHLARDLAGLGGSVYLVTPRPPAGLASSVHVLPVELIDDRLAPLIEILPIQFFIYRFACWRGLTPGSFRASVQVTLSETGRS